MKMQLTCLLMLLSIAGFTQKTKIDFMLGGVRSLPLSDFINSGKTEINGGNKTSFISVLFSHKIINPNIYFATGLNFSFKNARFQQNLDTLSYSGIIYTQPKYRIISIPLLLNFRKEMDMNFNLISEKKRVIGFTTGLSVDFVKEFSIRNGMTLAGKGFSIKTNYRNNFAFQSNVGVSFNSLLSIPIYKFKNDKNLYLVGAYKYPFYKQNSINLNYTINGDTKDFKINTLRLQEISVGISFQTSK